MNDIPRYLITTADERTWKFDCPVIFLGEWCQLYDRKHIWQEMDAIVAKPYGLEKSAKVTDFLETKALEERLFSVLYLELNKYHQTQHGERFWRIVLGHWLRHYVEVMLNRIKTLEQCLNNYSLSGFSAFSSENYSLHTQDLSEAIWAFNDDKWNSILYARILNLLGIQSNSIEVNDDAARDFFSLPTTQAKNTFKTKILRWGHRKLGQVTAFLSGKNDAFIINSYLPKKEQLKLELSLGQMPQLWVSNRPTLSTKFDCTLRQKLAGNIKPNSIDNRYSILCELVFELMPVSYLEGFNGLTKVTRELQWPETPKLIFTSNNFYVDEVFKVWAAYKTEVGVPYYVGQHGNNYGVTEYMLNPSVEELTSDKFITWGWVDGLTQHTPAFIFKTLGHKPKRYNAKGGLLLVETFLSLPIRTWDVTAEYKIYFAEQLSFIEKLDDRPKEKLTVRLHGASRLLRWNEKARFAAFDKKLKVEVGGTTIADSIAQSRLVVHGYDSTGILETLSQNIPTLAFWQNDFDHLRESAKPFYQLLVNAGIVHLTPESVAAKVNEVWDDVDSWWMQDSVQNARKQFCDRYAVVSNHPINDLKNIFKAGI